MPKRPTAYHVTLTAVRNPRPGNRAPDRSQLWEFSQLVWSRGGYSTALEQVLDAFFDQYPGNAIVIPAAQQSYLVIGSCDRARAVQALRTLPTNEQGDYELRSDDALLSIVKMNAMSGDTPDRLAPLGDRALREKLQDGITVYTPPLHSQVPMQPTIHPRPGKK